MISNPLMIKHLNKLLEITSGWKSSPIPLDKQDINMNVNNPIKGKYKSGAWISSLLAKMKNLNFKIRI